MGLTGIVVGILAGCESRTKIADIQAISMTHEILAPGETLESRGPVSARYCVDTLRDRGSIGLLDEVTANVQSENNVDFITQATLSRVGGGCFELSGMGQVVVAAPHAPPPQPSVSRTSRPSRGKLKSRIPASTHSRSGGK